MARNARTYSESGFVHVILRGIGRQILFEHTDDYCFFIQLMKKYCEELDVRVNAYCLMENHVHLLLQDTKRELSVYMKKIGVSYAAYYNSKYDRTGHLFQDRYKSIPIDSERQLLSTFRYILQNPEKAGICKSGAYKWSSYKEYSDQRSFTDTSLIERLIGPLNEFETFMSADEKQQAEFEPKRISDNTAHEIMALLLGTESGTYLQKCGKEDRNQALKLLKEQGLSIRQIERLTGIGRGIIHRA